MRIYSKHVTILIIACFIQASGHTQSLYPSIEQQIFIGNFNTADSLIDLQLKQDLTNKEQASLYHYKGDINKLRGDIDEAFNDWKKSNDYRKESYQKNDYHLAWNYALLSNYYYEKINTDLAIIYADSCSILIKNLNIEQQKEIEIYKIWNILGQSYKQKDYNHNPKNKFSPQELINYYQLVVRPYFLKSIAFQEKYHTPIFYLAGSYHLLANSYTDLTFHEFNISEGNRMKNFNKGFNYYQKSIQLIKEEFGSKHYRLGLTYFVRTLLTVYTEEQIKNGKVLIENDFEHSLIAFGIEKDSVTKQTLENIPNKEDLLMCLQHYTIILIKWFNTTKDIEYLNKAIAINNKAIQIWQIIFTNFKAKNINKNLSIYGLVPFSQTIAIEFLKKENQLLWSENTIFEANQKLKYFDFINWELDNTKNKLHTVSLQELQQQLRNKQCFLDFNLNSNYVQGISKDATWLIKLPPYTQAKLALLHKAIIEFDYNTYTQIALQLYNIIFKGLNFKHYVICADGIADKIPFEALLCSNKNTTQSDYRKLDYLLLNANITYVLSAAKFTNEKTIQNTSLIIDAFAPYNAAENLSKLPFSKQMVLNIEQNNIGSAHIYGNVTKQMFLSSKSPILHLSAHGLINQQNAMQSALVFSDNLLYLKDVYQTKINATLIVLNTCNSALGKYRIGDGVDGFVRAFHAKGVPTTLSNIWEVDDKISNQLLSNFYDYLNKGNSTTEALALAKKNRIINAANSKLAAPYYWAGHQLIGQELAFEKPTKSYSNRFIWLIGIGCIGLFVLLYFIVCRKKKKPLFSR